MLPLQHLLAELIDYAGLFPPAGLGMSEVVDNYAEYLSGDHSWMLGRLVIPLARLDEFQQVAQEAHLPPVRISLLTPPLDAPDDAFAAAVRSIVEFNSRSLHTVDAIEVRVSDPVCISNAAMLPESVECFIEVPLDRLAESLQSISNLQAGDRVFAKIRTGGVTPDLIPAPEKVAGFIAACREAGVGLKATAGLHHPFRAEFPLTYEPDAPTGTMHGFVNVFVGTCLVHAGVINRDQLVQLLEETEAGEFELAAGAVSWRGMQADTATVSAARRSFAISFGSCSFVEPVSDLNDLNLLPERPDEVG